MAQKISKFKISIMSFLTLMMVVLSYQNCGQPVKFQTSDGSKKYEATCVFGCFEGKLDPVLGIFKPEVKVLFVVDNSNSMSGSQARLSNGAQNFISKLKGFDASFYVHTTTQTGSNQIIGPSFNQCTWEENGEPKSGGLCSPTKPITYVQETKYQIAPPIQSGPLKITQSMTNAEFSSVQSSLTNAIKNVGTSGDSSEKGICSIARTIYDEGPNKIFKSGDIGAIVLISDEEDESSPVTCLSRKVTTTKYKGQSAVTQACTDAAKCDTYNYKVIFSKPYNERKVTFTCEEWNTNLPCTSGCNKWDYTVKFNPSFSENYQYSCQEIKYVDGYPVGPTPGPVQYGSLVPSTCNSNGSTIGACTAEQLTAAQTACGAKPVFPDSCIRKCIQNTTPTDVKYTDSTGSETNFCSSPVTISSVGYSNLVDYAQKLRATSATASCSRLGYKSGYKTSGTKSLSPTREIDCSTTVTDSDITNATNSCKKSNSLNTLNGGSVKASCTVQSDKVERMVLEDYADYKSVNLCSNPFTIEETDYPNLKEYAKVKFPDYSDWNIKDADCFKLLGKITVNPPGLLVDTQQIEEFTFPSNTPKTSPIDLKQSIINRSNEIFGTEGYFISSIVHNSDLDPAAGCPTLESWEKYGDIYKALVDLTPSGGNVSSICSPDYSTSLSEVEEFIKISVDSRYKVPGVSAKDYIYEVWLQHKVTGEVIELVMDVDIQTVGPTIEFLTDKYAGKLKDYFIHYRVETLSK